MHKTFADESRRIKKLLSFHSRPRLHSHINHVHSAFFDSQTETIITQHSNTFPSLDLSKSLAVKGDGNSYQLTITLVSFPMASLVILVVVMIHISFANAKISVTKQFAAFIGRNFELTFPRRGKP